MDLNGDKFVQANEIVLQPRSPLSYTSGYDYNNPTKTSTTGKVDPNLTDDRADELLVSFDKQIGNDFAVSASYIWRKYQQLPLVADRQLESGELRAGAVTPAATTCPAGRARARQVTYYEPTSQSRSSPTPTPTSRTTGAATTASSCRARKRMSKSWMLNASYSLQRRAGALRLRPKAYQDPTNIEIACNGGQYAPESTSSGLGNVFVNAEVDLPRVGRLHDCRCGRLAWSAFYNARSGYPFIRTIQTPTRPNQRAASRRVYLDKRGDDRLPNFQTVDFRIDKPFTIAGRVKVMASMDIFNLMNGHTSLSIRGTQNVSNANSISSLLAPRVFRFGFRMTF